MDLDTPPSHSPPPSTNPLRLPSTCDPPSETNPPQRAVWLIFGATGHMGRSLVRAVLAHGDACTAVGWSQENTMEQLAKWGEGKSNFVGMLCDVRIRETVDVVLRRSVERWGRVDVVVNCTGYGVIAACEDQDDYDLRNQFSTNFMGTLHIIQLTLPIFRAQPSGGRFLIFSSTSGALGVPGVGPYCATKYAVEGLIESMHYEVDCFGIKATLVEPGHTRLDEPDDQAILSSKPLGGDSSAGSYVDSPHASGMSLAPKRFGLFMMKPTPSEPYRHTSSPSHHAQRIMQYLIDRQPVSVVKTAELVWQLGHCRYPPLRILLGSYAVESVRDRMRSIIEEIEDWKHLSFPATLPPDEPSTTSHRLDADDLEQDEQEDD